MSVILIFWALMPVAQAADRADVCLIYEANLAALGVTESYAQGEPVDVSQVPELHLDSQANVSLLGSGSSATIFRIQPGEGNPSYLHKRYDQKAGERWFEWDYRMLKILSRLRTKDSFDRFKLLQLVEKGPGRSLMLEDFFGFQLGGLLNTKRIDRTLKNYFALRYEKAHDLLLEDLRATYDVRLKTEPPDRFGGRKVMIEGKLRRQGGFKIKKYRVEVRDRKTGKLLSHYLTSPYNAFVERDTARLIFNDPR